MYRQIDVGPRSNPWTHIFLSTEDRTKQEGFGLYISFCLSSSISYYCFEMYNQETFTANNSVDLDV